MFLDNRSLSVYVEGAMTQQAARDRVAWVHIKRRRYDGKLVVALDPYVAPQFKYDLEVRELMSTGHVDREAAEAAARAVFTKARVEFVP